MKNDLVINKKIQRMSIVVLILILAIVSIAAISPAAIQQKSVSQMAIEKYKLAQKNPNLTDEEKIKAAIDAYFTTHYESQKLLETQDFSQVLESSNLKWVDREKDKRDLELYIALLFNLKYQSYNFTLDYDSIQITNNKAVVKLRESHEVVFEVLAPDVSKMSDLKHELVLHKKNGVWAIYQDNYQDEYSQLLTHETKASIKIQIHQTYLNRLQHKSLVLDQTTNLQPLSNQSSLNNYTYNRTAARDYADKYWSTLNPPNYKALSEDCTNFGSQAIYAGEGKTPPDTSGMNTSGTYKYDWYYVWKNSGSLPWIRVQDQYVRITLNSSGRIGPYGIGSTNRCLARIGDIVQLFNNDNTGTWDHEGIIVESPYPQSCDISLFKIDAHTINRKHYSLSFWSGFPMRYILVKGWRGN